MKHTEIIFLLDRSGSMAGKEKDTVGGYNRFIEEHDTPHEECVVTTVLFDDRYQVLYNGEPVKTAQIDERQYSVRGSTALYDAIGKTITKVEARQAERGDGERPQTYFVITTDGYENASHLYNAQMIRELIQTQQELHRWQVFFIGCDIDAALSAHQLGIAAENAFACDSDEDDFFCDILYTLNRKIEALPAEDPKE